MDTMIRNLVRQHSVERTALALFTALDQRGWNTVRRVLSPRVEVHLKGLSGLAEGEMEADQLVAAWERDLAHYAAVHHQIGNIRSSVHEDDGHMACSGTVFHRLPEAVGGELHIHVGTFDLGLRDSPRGWHVHTLRFRLRITQRIPSSASWQGSDLP